MASFDYAATAADVLALLEEFGAAAQLLQETTGEYDPAEGSAPVTTDELEAVAAVFAYEQSFIDGSLILQGDQLAYVAPTVAPRQGDRLRWQGTVYRIITCKPLAPAGVPVLYELQLRG